MDRALFRLGDIKLAISRIRILLAGKSLQGVQDDFVVSSAFERQLEIVSEASRHLPEEWKHSQGPEVDWRNVASLGNRLRHIYDKTDLSILWEIYRRPRSARSGHRRHDRGTRAYPATTTSVPLIAATPASWSSLARRCSPSRKARSAGRCSFNVPFSTENPVRGSTPGMAADIG